MMPCLARRFRSFAAWLAVAALIFQAMLPAEAAMADVRVTRAMRDAAVLCSDHGNAFAPAGQNAGAGDCPYCAASSCASPALLLPQALNLPFSRVAVARNASATGILSTLFPLGHSRARAPPPLS
ncbi:MAG: hypothetical protein HQL43_07770 [Alphaproteobacteria bacterium]|nr:hypothetical protein [Alphaproteobacteria bacterium]